MCNNHIPVIDAFTITIQSKIEVWWFSPIAPLIFLIVLKNETCFGYFGIFRPPFVYNICLYCLKTFRSQAVHRAEQVSQPPCPGPADRSDVDHAIISTPRSLSISCQNADLFRGTCGLRLCRSWGHQYRRLCLLTRSRKHAR